MLAVSLIAVALVPALRLMRNSFKIGRDIENRGLLVNYCVSKLEEQIPLLNTNWASGAANGNLAADGYSHVRYEIAHSDAAADGGIPDRLMAIVVTVWDDSNGNTSLDSDESQVTMRTKISKLSTYPGAS
jgi:hypothetical protein